MKLCLIAPVAPPYGGVSNWECIVEKQIRKDASIELHIINIASNKRPIDGRNLFDRVVYSGYVMLRADRELKKLIKQKKVDCVHMTTSGGLGFYRDLLLLRRLNKYHIPAIYHIHFGRAVHYFEAQDRNWKFLIKTISRASAIITLDEKTQKLLQNYHNNICRINNPIDLDSIKRDRTVVGNKIVYVGWIIKEKGIEELIQAFQIFNGKNNGKYELELVGRGQDEYINYLHKTYNCHSVSFIGEVNHDEAMKHIAEGEVFVLPSYTEGSPNVILEAMALQKPIIATNVGSIPYMLADDSGIIIESQNVREIENSLECLLYDEQKKRYIASNAYKRVVECFDISTIYQKYKDIWCEKVKI